MLLTSSPPLCEHTTAPRRAGSDADILISKARQNMLRNFSYRAQVLTFSVSILEDIFELRVPRLKIMRHRHVENAEKDVRPETEPHLDRDSSAEDDRKQLRREIKEWWQGLSDHMDKLVSISFASFQDLTSFGLF